MIAASRGSKYATQIQILLLTGCRPQELVNGIEVSRQQPGTIHFRILGAKCSENTGGGQEWRTLLIEESALTKGLDSGSYSVPTPAAIENAIEHFGHRLWPKRAGESKISAYTFRHLTASDFKASGLSSADISAALGHSSLVTKDAYGSASRRRDSRVKLLSVAAARLVREPTKASRRSPKA